MVLASSSSVYGESATLSQHEGLCPSPLSPYALHKFMGEEYAKLFNRLHGLETVAVLAGQAATIHGDGEQTRDFTYVTDAVRATIAACTSPAAAGRVINIARGKRLSVNALYAMLQRITGTVAQARHIDRRTGDVHNHALYANREGC